MNEIKSIYYARLNNGDFYQFIENIVTIVSNEPLAAGVIQVLATDQPILLNSYKKELLTEETKQIVLLDLRRDRAYTKFKTIVEGFAYDDETPANAAAAKKLLTFIKQHGAGKLVSFDYNKETASITSLIADCRDHAGTELVTLNVKSMLDFLETCNAKFKDFYATRGDAASVLANVTPFYKLRKEVGDHYKTMVNDLESLQRFIPASAAKIGDLITRVNVEIDKFRLLVPTTPTPASPPTP